MRRPFFAVSYLVLTILPKADFPALEGTLKEACDLVFDALDKRTLWETAEAEWLLASDSAFGIRLSRIVAEELSSLRKTPDGAGGKMVSVRH